MIEGLVIDSFAGGGGASLGISMALGRHPDVAINHDSEAVAMHKANHPTTQHYCKNVWQADPSEVVRAAGGGPVALAWFSPDCKHFSKAKGGRPVKRNIRDLAWVVVLWAKRVRPRMIFLENVEEFRDWGPVNADGKPCKERKGQTYQRWIGELTRLGYNVEWRELRGCDYGAPTIRKRLFMIARCDGKPIVWPEPTHNKDGTDGLKPYRTAADCIDWSIPTHSIFLSPEEAKKVGVRRPLAEKTLARIARGVKKYVLDAANPFLLHVAHGDSGGRREYPLDEPLGTITGQGVQHGIAQPFVMPLTHHGGDRTYSVGNPLNTVTGAHRGEMAVVQPELSFLAGVGGRMGQSPERGMFSPVQTVTAKGDTALVTPFVTKFRTGSTGHAMDEPMHTVTAGGDMKRPAGAAHAMGLVSAFMTRFNENGTGQEMKEPVDTVMAGAPRFGVVSAFMNQQNTGVIGHDMREPVSTLTGKGSQQTLTAANMVLLKGSNDGSRQGDLLDPAPTVAASGNHQALVSAFLCKYFSEGGQWSGVGEPMHTVTTKDRMTLVTVQIDGVDYVLTDIGMRMLTPRELFTAQGFPLDYKIDPVFKGKKLSKTAQVKCCGNAVNPQVAEALVRANVEAEPMQQTEAA